MAFELKNLEVLNLVRPLPTIAREVEREFGLNVVTSAWRDKDLGVHGYWRGLDLRCRNEDQGTLVEKWVKKRWIYDPGRPGIMVCIGHGEGTNYHIHLQVHPNTQRRK